MREVMMDRSKFVQYGENACMCTIPRAHGAQLRRSQTAFIVVVVMKLESVSLRRVCVRVSQRIRTFLNDFAFVLDEYF
jgi:hypothetical protein